MSWLLILPYVMFCWLRRQQNKNSSHPRPLSKHQYLGSYESDELSGNIIRPLIQSVPAHISQSSAEIVSQNQNWFPLLECILLVPVERKETGYQIVFNTWIIQTSLETKLSHLKSKTWHAFNLFTLSTWNLWLFSPRNKCNEIKDKWIKYKLLLLFNWLNNTMQFLNNRKH